MTATPGAASMLTDGMPTNSSSLGQPGDNRIGDALREVLRSALAQVNTLRARQTAGSAAGVRRAAGRWPPADRGPARPGQDHAGACAGGDAGPWVSSACSSPPTCCLRTSSASRCSIAQARRFEFHPGPIFAHVLLADEINRAPPRTQSALLEAMAEHQVTVDGNTHALPEPFFVIATQNPVDLAGTYPLPDSQLDRFLLRLTLGYPGEDAERALLSGADRRDLIAQAVAAARRRRCNRVAARSGRRACQRRPDRLRPVTDDAQPAASGRARRAVATRGHRAAARGARLCVAAWSHHVLPDDVQALFNAVAAHRLVVDADAGKHTALAKAILHAVPVD